MMKPQSVNVSSNVFWTGEMKKNSYFSIRITGIPDFRITVTQGNTPKVELPSIGFILDYSF